MLDQRALIICQREIERCRSITPRPNIIALLGDRYGWRPLLSEIPAREFQTIVDGIPDSADCALIESWYRLDANAVPPLWWLQPRVGDAADMRIDQTLTR
jgi:hypothetical protein